MERNFVLKREQKTSLKLSLQSNYLQELKGVIRRLELTLTPHSRDLSFVIDRLKSNKLAFNCRGFWSN